MSERESRKRIPYKSNMLQPVDDELTFSENKCSDHARKIFAGFENIRVELWFDKHYYDRHQHGDDNGKREGIDPQTVENLVRRSIKHLLLYGAANRGFKFINYEGANGQPVKIVLQEEFDGSMLNVVIETHFVEINKYEITVKTAMCTDDFRIAMGQYVVELLGDGSILKRFDNKKLVEICSF